MGWVRGVVTYKVVCDLLRLVLVAVELEVDGVVLGGLELTLNDLVLLRQPDDAQLQLLLLRLLLLHLALLFLPAAGQLRRAAAAAATTARQRAFYLAVDITSTKYQTVALVSQEIVSMLNEC